MYESRYDIEDTVSELRKQVDESQRELVKTTKELNKLEMDVQSTNVESEELQVSQPHRQSSSIKAKACRLAIESNSLLVVCCNLKTLEVFPILVSNNSNLINDYSTVTV